MKLIVALYLGSTAGNFYYMVKYGQMPKYGISLTLGIALAWIGQYIEEHYL